MKSSYYVICIKQIKYFNTLPVPKENQVWKCAGLDYPVFGDSITPCFADFNEDTVLFDSIEQAEQWWNNNKPRLMPWINEGYYDASTLCIQKRVVVVESEPVKNISIEEK